MRSSCPGRRSRACDAFTLIEVLITLVVLSTGIILVMRAFETSLVALCDSRDAVWATLLISEKLAEIEAGGPSAGRASGAFSRPYDDFRWERRVLWADGDASNALYRVSVSVWRAGVSRKYAAVTQLYSGGNK